MKKLTEEEGLLGSLARESSYNSSSVNRGCSETYTPSYK